MARSPITVSLRSAQSTPLSASQNDANLTNLKNAILLSSECPANPTTHTGIGNARIADNSSLSTINPPTFYNGIPGEFTEVKTPLALGLPAGSGYAIVVTYSDASGFVKQEAITQASSTVPLRYMRIGTSSGWSPWYYMPVLSVDPATQVWQTGDYKFSLQAVAQTGWIIANDGSIGNAGSGASTRANADTFALFSLLWTGSYRQFAPISGGTYGANATADFNAGKTIKTGTVAGRILMAAGAGAGLTPRASGNVLGIEQTVLTPSQCAFPVHNHTQPAHTHSIAPHSHNIKYQKLPQSGSNTQCVTVIGSGGDNGSTDSGGTTTTGSAGGENTGNAGGTSATTPVSMMQPGAVVYLLLKL